MEQHDRKPTPGQAAAATRASEPADAMALPAQHEHEQQVLAAVRLWLERAVVGLQLCPFAAQPLHGDRVRLRVSQASTPDALLADLHAELSLLHNTSEQECETTLLIHPHLYGASAQFEAFNDFLGLAEEAVAALGLEGELQVASFHPGYRFADAAAEDPANLSNRSPYPILHLLRESSLERAIDAHPDTDLIWRRNVERLRALGHAGWQRLWKPSGE